MVDQRTRPAPYCYPHAVTQWLAYGATYLQRLEGAEDIGSFGPPDAGPLAVEASALYAFIHALAAIDDGFNLDPSPFDIDHCHDQALAAFRYCLHTHRSHPRELPEEIIWGGAGMSPKMADQLALAAEVLVPQLDERDREDLARLIAYEADCNILLPFHLEHVDHGYYRKRPPVPTERFGNSYPESNAWRANVLARALLAHPSHPHASEWHESMIMHLANVFSVPADAEDESIIDGQRLCDLHVGANLHPNFALEHHGFFHPGYVNRTLLSLFSAAYAFEDAGREAPQLLLRHVPEVWNVQRRLLLWDGRLAYPAGDDYPRYCWGQLYLLPALVFIQHQYEDPTAAWAERRLGEMIVREQQVNGDGSFCAGRLERWRELIENDDALLPSRPAPSVYYRSQVDAAYYTALAWWWHRRDGMTQIASDEEADDALEEPFCEPDCGLVFHRAPKRFASWSWNAYRCGAQGLVLPRDGDHMAEWQGNLISRFYVRGAQCNRRVISHQEHCFDGGIATTGTMAACDTRISHTVAFAALPDGRTTIYCSNARALAPVELLVHEGMCLNVANDIFNGNRRTVYSQRASHEIRGVGAEAEQLPIDSPWVNVDDMLGVIEMDGRERFTLSINGERRADGHSLCYDELWHPYHDLKRSFGPDAVVEDAAVAFVTSLDARETARWPAWHIGPSRVEQNVRALTVRGVNDVWYLLAASFSDELVDLHLPLTMQAAGSRILVGERHQFGLVGDGAVLVLPPRGMLLVALAVDAQ
ncbi:MAG: hypothetical protein ACOX9R_18265 [Armatimonadota bacterium]|jgi:hypothetical protein